MENTEIRQAARSNFIPMWKIASKIGVSEITLVRWMRKEMPEDKRARIMAAINELSQEGASA